METRKVNKFGRSYRPGVALDQDFKCSIIVFRQAQGLGRSEVELDGSVLSTGFTLGDDPSNTCSFSQEISIPSIRFEVEMVILRHTGSSFNTTYSSSLFS